MEASLANPERMKEGPFLKDKFLTLELTIPELGSTNPSCTLLLSDTLPCPSLSAKLACVESLMEPFSLSVRIVALPGNFYP
jgi:hypothetical protein